MLQVGESVTRIMEDWELEFEKGDYVFVKVSPSKGIMRLERNVKLNPRFIGPFVILHRVGTVAYQIALWSDLS